MKIKNEKNTRYTPLDLSMLRHLNIQNISFSISSKHESRIRYLGYVAYVYVSSIYLLVTLHYRVTRMVSVPTEVA
jgi:hypothetical protein